MESDRRWRRESSEGVDRFGGVKDDQRREILEVERRVTGEGEERVQG